MAAEAEAIERLANLGPKSCRMLAAAGVRSVRDLRELGAVEAYRRVRAANPSGVSLNMLWALQGALLGLKWTDLPPEMKADLKAQVFDADG